VHESQCLKTSSSVHDVSNVVLCCVQAMLSVGNSSVGEQHVHMPPVARDLPVSSSYRSHTPESFVMSGASLPQISLSAAPVASSSHAQVCIHSTHIDDVRHAAC